MKCSFVWLMVCALVTMWALPASAAERQAPTKTIDAFIEAIKADKSLPAEKVTAAVTAAEELKADAPSQSAVITVGLRELYEDYASALVDMADENLTSAVPKLEKLAKSDNAYLATDATFFLARAYMLTERFEESLPLLKKVQEKSALNVQHADTAFLVGLCEARLLKRKDAIATFKSFESDFPAAPERMRIGAWRMLQQLQLVKDGTINDVQDRMDFSRRKLALEDSGKSTQDEQKKIVDILAKLIEEAEKRECECSGSGKGEGEGRKPGSGQNSGGPSPGEGQAGKTGGKGSGSDNSQNTDIATQLRRSGPASGWAKLRDKDREQVIGGLKTKYPARYEKLVEDYYKSFDESK